MPPPAPRTERAIWERLAEAGINLNCGEGEVDTDKPWQSGAAAGEKEAVIASGPSVGEDRSNCEDTANDPGVMQWPGQSQEAEKGAPLNRSLSERYQPGELVSQVFLANNETEVSSCTDYIPSSKDTFDSTMLPILVKTTTKEVPTTENRDGMQTLDNTRSSHVQLNAKQCLMRNITKFFKGRIDQISHSNQDCAIIPLSADSKPTTFNANDFGWSSLSSGASVNATFAGSDTSGSDDRLPAPPRTTPLDSTDRTTQTEPSDPRTVTEHSSLAGVERYARNSFLNVRGDGSSCVPDTNMLEVLDGGTLGSKTCFSVSQRAHSQPGTSVAMSHLCDSVPSTTVAVSTSAPECNSTEKHRTADQLLIPITSTSEKPTMPSNMWRQPATCSEEEILLGTVSGTTLKLTPITYHTPAVPGTSNEFNGSNERGNDLLMDTSSGPLDIVSLRDSYLSEAPCFVSDSLLSRKATVPDDYLAVDTPRVTETQHAYPCSVSASSSGYFSNSSTPALDSAGPSTIPASDSGVQFHVVYYPDLGVCDYIEETEVEIVPTRSINPSLFSRLGDISEPSQEMETLPSLPGNKICPSTKSVLPSRTLASLSPEKSSAGLLVGGRQMNFQTKPSSMNTVRDSWCTGVSEPLQSLPTSTAETTLASAASGKIVKRRVIVHPRIVATSGNATGTTSTVANNTCDTIPDENDRALNEPGTSYSFSGTDNITTHTLFRGSNLASIAAPSLAPSTLKRSRSRAPHSARRVTLITVPQANSRHGKHSYTADVNQRALKNISYVPDGRSTFSTDRMAPYTLSHGQKNYEDTISEIYEEISGQISDAMEDTMDTTVRKIIYDPQLTETYNPTDNPPKLQVASFSHDPSSLISTRRVNVDRDLQLPNVLGSSCAPRSPCS